MIEEPKREDYTDDQIWSMARKVLIRYQVEKLRFKAVRQAKRAVVLIYPEDYKYLLSRERYERSTIDQSPKDKKGRQYWLQLTRKNAIDHLRRNHGRTFDIALSIYWAGLMGHAKLPGDPIAEIKRRTRL